MENRENQGVNFVETIENKGNEIYYEHDNKDDKHYFGGFLNIAQNNIKLIFDEFCTRIDMPKDENINNIIEKYFKDKTSHSDWEKRIEILKEYLPVIEYLDLPVTDILFENYNLNERESKKKEYFRTNILNLIKCINDLRNYYTHYYHSSIVINENVFDFLDSTLLKVCLEVKKKKMKDDKTRQILKQRISEDLEILKSLKKEELKKRNAEGKKADPYNKEAIQNAIYNDAFHHLIYKSGMTQYLSDFQKARYSNKEGDKNKTPISKGGLVFLLSLFLTKKEAEQLKANIRGFKAKVIGKDDVVTRENNSLKYMATHWVFSYLTFKGLKRRVKTTFDKPTLLMQMIDELSKVPDKVYQTFSLSNKEGFLEDMNEFVQESTDDAYSLQKSTVVHPVIRKRYEDKFNYFAIRFLDEFANFPTLKFQVFAGYYKHDNRPKEIKGSSFITDRIIKERINVFGKLSEVAKYKSNYFYGEIDEQAWELFPNPSYNFVANNIHIHINLNNKTIEDEITRIKKETDPNPKYKKRGVSRITKSEIAGQIYKKAENIKYKEPTALFSLNELPALLYELLVNNKSGAELEKILVHKIITHYTTIKNYDTNQKLSNSFITKKLNKSKTKQNYVDSDKLLRALKKEIEITEEKLKQIKTNREECEETDRVTKKPKRKYIFYTNELGQEATWLAYDLKRFMPKTARKIWKGYQHNELQRFLAFYEMNKNEAKNLLTENWDLNSFPLWGSDINKAFSQRTFDSFFKYYLDSRKKTLVGFVESINNFNNEPKLLRKVLNEIFIVFDKRLFIINSTENQKRQLLAKPIVFPRGIFDQKPTFIHGKRFEQAPLEFANWYQYCYYKSHQFQEFYKTQRDYVECFEKHKKENKEWKLNKKKLTYAQMFELFKKKQDLIIKKVMHKDLFVKLMIDHLFKKVFKQDINTGLQEIYQTQDERRENQRVANKQKEREKGDISENIRNANFIWNRTISMRLFDGQITEPEIKLKDIGKLRKLETDKKVQHILSYNSTKIWNKIMLEDELENKQDSFERIRREKLLKVVQSFEKLILEKYSENSIEHPKEFEYDGNPNFRKYITYGVLNKISDVPESEINWLGTIMDLSTVEISEVKNKSVIIQKAYVLILLRNKFGHNQLPCKEAFNLMQTFSNKENNETYSNFFFRLTEQIINELTD